MDTSTVMTADIFFFNSMGKTITGRDEIKRNVGIYSFTTTIAPMLSLRFFPRQSVSSVRFQAHPSKDF